MPLAYVAWRTGTIGLSYRSARLGIDFWAPLRVHKYGLCRNSYQVGGRMKCTQSTVASLAKAQLHKTTNLPVLFRNFQLNKDAEMSFGSFMY